MRTFRSDLPVFTGRESIKSLRPCSIQLTEQSFLFSFQNQPIIEIFFKEILGWEFFEIFFCINYKGLWLAPDQLHLTEHAEACVVIKLKETEVTALQKQFNQQRVHNYLHQLPENMRQQQKIISCPRCELLINITSCIAADMFFCPECCGIFKDSCDVTIDQGCQFNFCSSGKFTLLGRQGDLGLYKPTHSLVPKSLEEECQPVREKMYAHILWTGLWSCLLWALMPYPMALIFFMVLTVFHITMVGNYFTHLALLGGLKIAPRFEKITKNLFKGRFEKGFKLLKKYHQENHPGLLANVATALSQFQKKEQALQYIHQAITLCPNHPVLLQLAHHITKDQIWQDRLNEILREHTLKTLD